MTEHNTSNSTIYRAPTLLWGNSSGELDMINNTHHSHHGYINPYLAKMPALQYFFVVCLGFQAILGTFGNLLVIGAVCIVPALRTTANAFIINLSLADLFVTSVTQPFNIVGALFGEKWFDDRPVLCSIISTLCATGCIASTWNICMISINRYIMICFFEYYDKIYTRWKTFLMCLAVWLVMYSIELPNHIGWGDNRFSNIFFMCTFAVHVHHYALFFIGLGVCVPVGLAFLAYYGIYNKVRNSSLVRNRILNKGVELTLTHEQRLEKRKNRRQFQENVRVAQALFKVFIIFLIMWIPVAVVILMGMGLRVHHVWYILTVLMAHGNSSINCFVYAASIDHFREGYCRLLGIRSDFARGKARGTSVGPTTNMQSMQDTAVGDGWQRRRQSSSIINSQDDTEDITKNKKKG